MTDSVGQYSETSGITNDTETKKKKGLKKLVGKVFGKKRRKRRKGGGSGSSQHSEGSYDSYSAQSSEVSDALRNPDGSTNTAAQQAWIHGGASGLAEMAAIDSNPRDRSTISNKRTNSAGGRGKSLTGIPELPELEDAASSGPDLDAAVSGNRHGGSSQKSKRRGKKPKNSSSASASVSSKDSKRSRGSFFGRSGSSKQTPKADPLSLVVLLVEPSSLRFELLSLDFDLTTTKPSGWKARRSKEASAPELPLTVQDVLDEITPQALTDETLQARARKARACRGLIDRTGTVHFGGASLEAACGHRPLRAMDQALLKQQLQQLKEEEETGDASSPSTPPPTTVSLSVPTFGGEPHRDVLLGFFLDDDDDDDDAVQEAGPAGSLGLSQATKEGVAHSLELARPIFADPNVIGLLESSGYNMVGWKPATTLSSSSVSKEEPTKLGKPLPAPPRKKQASLGVAKLLLGLMAVLLATVLAYSMVAGGLHALPSVTDENHYIPSTMEGHVLWAYESAKSWYFNSTSGVDTVAASTTKKAFLSF